jgi:hypothetical protein
MNKVTNVQLSRQAQLLGLKTFQTYPCKSVDDGGVQCGCTERRVAGMCCVACDRKRSKAYNKSNKKKCADSNAKWRNTEENKAYIKLLSAARAEESEHGKEMVIIAKEFGLTLLDVVTEWGNRVSLNCIFKRDKARFKIICAGVRDLSK